MFKSMAVAWLGLLLAAGSALAIEPCAQETQAVLLTKAVSLTTGIGGSAVSEITIGVLGGGPMVALIEKAAKESKTKIGVREVGPESVTEVQVLFVPLGTSAELLEEARTNSRSGKVMTATGNPQDALDHDLTLSFHTVADKSRIMINLTAGTAEGIEFAPQLLTIADRFHRD